MASPGLAKQRRELIKLWLKWRAPLFGALALGAVLVGARFAYQYLAVGKSEQRQDTLQTAGNSVAEQISKALAADFARLEAFLDDDELSALFNEGDAAAISAREAELAGKDDALLRVWLLKPGVDQPDYASTPPLSYASLALLRRSEGSDTAIAPEVHLFKDKGQHIAVARRIPAAGETLLGHALLAVDVGVLVQAMRGVSLTDGYAELLQPVAKGRPVVLAKTGDPGLRKGVPKLQIPVGGTAWRVGYWTPGGQPEQSQSDGLPLPILGGGVALVVVAVALVLVRRRRQGGPKEAGDGQADPPEITISEKLAALKKKPSAEGAPIPAGAGEGSAEAAADAQAAQPRAKAAKALSASIFRAYDIRGVVGDTLDADIVRELGRAIGSEAYDRGVQGVVAACDGRLSSPELLEALVEGLRASGRDVIDVGRVPTPLLYFATHFFDTGSGVMITGSHNPPDYNGLKIMLAGDTLFGDDIQALKTRIESGNLASGQGNLQSMEVVDEYIRRVSEDVPVALGNSFKVVVDCGNGIAGAIAPKLFRALGHDVVELYCEVDGNFPNHHPDPSDPANLQTLITTIKEQEADLGFAFDGDGDRLGVVDSAGNIIWPDRQMMLYARDVLSRNAGAEIIFDVKCSSRLAKVIAKLGGKPVMWKTGHSLIKSKLKESGAPLAGEMSGHIFFKERWYGFDDALYTAARLLEILMAFSEKPTEVFAKLPDGVNTPELRVKVAEGSQMRMVEQLVDGGHFTDGTLCTIDGLRVDYPDAWGLVRASNTEPCLVLRFEADNGEALERIQGQFKEVLLAIDPELTLPF